MDSFETKLGLLSDTLYKKADFLRRILTITENQESVLVASKTASDEDADTLNAMFRQMNDEKQKLIDELLGSDRFFEHIFNELSDEFENRAGGFKPLIAKMQAAIIEVTDLDVKIRLQERKNRSGFKDEPPSKAVDFTKASREYMISQYRKNNDGDE